MNEKIKKITVTVKDKWSGFSNAVRAMLISIPIVLVAIIILLVIIANHKDSSVLYSGLTTEEAVKISAAIEALGVSSDDIQVSGGTIKVPSDKQDYLRMQLAVQGYPETSSSYDIWNNGINLWTTQDQKNEVARQQREANIASTVRQLDAVQQCTANLSLPETKEYTINPNTDKHPSCNITIRLNGDKELTNDEVRAIFAIASKSVEGLTTDDISIVDTKGRTYDYISKEEEMAEGVDASGVPIARKRYAFEHSMQEALTENLRDWLEKIYGVNGYAVTVNTRLNYDNKDVESVHYYPIDGDKTGVLETDRYINTNVGLNNSGGIVGEGPNADLSPDYPTYVGNTDLENYYYTKSEKQYDVSYIKESIKSDGYEIENLSVAVALNLSELSDRDTEIIRGAVANAAGTTTDKVGVLVTPFKIQSGSNSGLGNGNGLGIITRPVDPYRNMLLILVIALGIILVILLIASLFISKSRKKKIRSRQELAFAAAQAAAENNVAFSSEGPEEVDFNITSLTEEAGKESRETILKREIAEFARTSPDIVASIIKNMLRDE